jgi:hypothetical protein
LTFAEAVRKLEFTIWRQPLRSKFSPNIGLAELISDSFIQSHQFTFFVGREGKTILVHAAAIAATSEQLDALINGGMEKSILRCARIEDVQVDDFIRFCEYAYLGDYTVPPWEELQHEPISTPGTIQQDEGKSMWGNDDWEPMSSKKKKGKKGRVAIPEPAPEEALPSTDIDAPPNGVGTPPSTSLRNQFNSRKYLDGSGPRALILQHFEPKSNSAVNQDFTPVFLAHARLYCFAHLRLIAPLKALTLSKLHETLVGFNLYPQRVGDIIELARYVYSNPDLPQRNEDGTLDNLKELVVEYIVCEIQTIGKCDEFVKYIEE